MTEQAHHTPRSVPRAALLFFSPASIPIPAANDDDQPQHVLRGFSGVAYSGDVLMHPYWGQVAFDLDSTSIPTPLPLLMEHDRGARAGIVEQATVAGAISVSGSLFAFTTTGKEAASLADAGFPWQMSVYIVPGSIEEVAPGASATVNGRAFTGPGVIFRNSVVREISLCSVAADPNTSAVAAADGGGSVSIPVITRSNTMPPDQTTPQEVAASVPAATVPADLEQKFSAMQAELDALKTENARLTKARRQDEVSRLFTDLGRAPEPAELERFHAMDDVTFQFVAGQLRAMKPQTPPELLFMEQATGGSANTNQAEIDRLAAIQ